jgi:hypothetical protein
LPPSSNSILRIGWSGDDNINSGSLFSGEMFDLRIFNRAMSSSEIVTLSQPYLTTYTNAINPSPIASSILYTWYCSSGSYGPTITLSRSSSDGTWSSSGSVNCLSCPTNSYSHDGFSSCISCPPGTVVSSAGCTPSSSLSFGLPSSPLSNSVSTQTLKFVYTGSIIENLGPFNSSLGSTNTITTSALSSITYTTSSLGVTNGALLIPSGSSMSLQPIRGNLVNAFPIGQGVPITLAARIQCSTTVGASTAQGALVFAWGGSSIF